MEHELGRLAADKPRYQDRFVILSRGPYSAVPAADTGLSEAEWLERSLVIRREHELTHYFTYRLFGSMRNHLLDEKRAPSLPAKRGELSDRLSGSRRNGARARPSFVARTAIDVSLTVKRRRDRPG